MCSGATHRSRARLDRGSVGLETVIVMPVLFVIMFLGMQAALYHHARTVAIAAAQEGARAAGAELGREHDGVSAATRYVADTGNADTLRGVTATAERTATKATVTVRGRSLSIVPGWEPQVTQSASVPVERVTSP